MSVLFADGFAILRRRVGLSLLQTAQTLINAEVCSASCAHALGSMFVCLFVCYSLFVSLFVCFTDNLGDWVSGKGGS